MNNAKDVKVGSQTFLFQRLFVGSMFWKITWKTTFIKNQFSLSHVCINSHPRNMKFPLGFEDKTNSLHCCCSVSKSNPVLCNSMDCSTSGFPVLRSPEFAQTHVHWVGDAIQPSHSLLPSSPLPPIFPRISVFSSESALPIRRLKYWSFSFSVSPSNEYSGLISFRIDWFDLLADQGTLKSLLQHHNSKASILWHSTFFIIQLSSPYMTTGKTIALTIQAFVSKNDVSDF